MTVSTATVFCSFAAALIAAILTHGLTRRRDRANRRSDLRIQYLLTAYRMLCQAANRDLPPGSDDARSLEQAIDDIQLLGSGKQAEMAIDVAREMSNESRASLDALLLVLRNDLRRELQLGFVEQPPIHLRMTGPGSGEAR